ncbi:unnamed protein product, partial [Mesorhabditis spiculigera]
MGSFDCDLAENINFLLQAFCIPLISTSCTASQMHNWLQFPYFLRTATDDTYRAQVMYDVLMSQEWYHIAVISDVSTTGSSLSSQFNNLLYYCTAAQDANPIFRNPCIERTFEFDCSNHQKVTAKLYELRDFLVESDVRVFVVFAKDDCMATILLDIQALGYKRGDLQFVLPSVPLNDSNLDILEYAYAVDDYIELVDTFENVIMNTPIKDTEVGPFRQLIMLDNLCWYGNENAPFSFECNGTETLRVPPQLGFRQARRVIDSLVWIAQSMERLHLNFCDAIPGFCPDFFQNFNGASFFEAMNHTSFNSFDSEHIFRPVNGSAQPIYNIYQRQSTAWVTVFGKYNPLEELEPAEDNVDPIDIPILSAILNETRTCQKDCENEIANFQPGCCWSCTACPTFAVVNATVQACVQCPENRIPNEHRNACVSFATTDLFLKPSSEMNVIIVLDALGILLTLPALAVLFYRRDTPMVRAATPDLAFQQTVIICLLFISSGLMIPSTSPVACGFVWGMSALLLTATHSISLAKSLRISRAGFFVRFGQRVKTPQKASLILHASMVFIQFFIITLWLLLRPPSIQWDRVTLFPSCTSNKEGQTIVLLLSPAVILVISLYFQKKACGNQYIYQVKQARIGLAGTLCFLVNYLVFIALILIKGSTDQFRTIVLMCIPMVTGYLAWITNLLPTTWEVLTKAKQNDQQYVSRQRSRQFQHGNIMYYVESVIFNRPKGLTINTIDSADGVREK